MNKNINKKILITMSGGVDSSVAAALLVKKGYDVTGMFAVNYNTQINADGNADKRGIECWRGDYEDALRVCAKLGIGLLRWDFVEDYKKDVLNYMYREYEVGNTPNPDVLCNKFIKFGAWLKRAKKEGFDSIATGHYARLSTLSFPRKRESRIRLLQSKDKNKDQTYFLHQLNQDQLKNIIFPLGNYTKKQVRKMAQKFDLPTADKEESMGICFVGEVSMKEFLKDKVKAEKGNIVLSSGEVVGEHDGLPFYTIGQKIGVKSKEPIANRKENKKANNKEPFFVIKKNMKENELVIGFSDDLMLYKKEIEIKNFHWIAGVESKLPLKCYFRLRHRQDLQRGTLNSITAYSLQLTANKVQRAVTPGQFAVIYKSKKCLGGGIIE